MSGLIYPEESYKAHAKSQRRKEYAKIFLCDPFASLREIFAFWDLDFSFLAKKLVLECFYQVWQKITCQLLNATELKLGLLVNFGHYPKLEYERLILTHEQ